MKSNKNKNTKRISGILYAFCAIMWLFSALLQILNEQRVLGTTSIALAVLFLALSRSYIKKSKEDF